MTQDVHKRAAAGSMLNRTDHSIDSEDNHPRREYLIGRATEVSVPWRYGRQCVRPRGRERAYLAAESKSQPSAVADPFRNRPTPRLDMPNRTHAWQDPSASPRERATRLVDAMSLEQKVALLHGAMETIDIYAVTADALESGADMDQLHEQNRMLDEPLGINPAKARVGPRPVARAGVDARPLPA
jgi:hypothetical protein